MRAKRMALVIDGYNLLNVTGVCGARGGARSFERSRQALLDCLADRLAPEERTATTVVLSSSANPALADGLPSGVQLTGMDFCQPMLDVAVRKSSASRLWARSCAVCASLRVVCCCWEDSTITACGRNAGANAPPVCRKATRTTSCLRRCCSI